MVNLGKSTGCSTCRRRRKKCDGRKPECARCEKGGFRCEGYRFTDGNTIFSTYDPEGDKQRRLRSSRESSQSTPRSRNSSPGDGSETSHILPAGLCRASFEVQVLDQFLDIYLPKTHCLMACDSASGWIANWIDAINRLSTQSDLLHTALTSIGLCSLAARSKNEDMRRKGTEMYGSALVKLSKTLQDPQTASTNDAVIPAIGLMGAYEQFNGFSLGLDERNQTRNWFAHIQGVARLLHLRGPHGFTSEYAFQALVACQFSQFASAFSSRKPCFLASPEWRSIPWHNRQKSTRDRFFDIVFKVPGLLQEADFAYTYGSPEMIKSSLSDLAGVVIEMQKWSTSCEALMPDEFSGITSKLMYSQGVDFYSEAVRLSLNMSLNWKKGSPNLLHDKDFMHSLMQMWGVMINLSMTFQALRAKLPVKEARDYEIIDPLPYVVVILQCLPLCVQDGGIVGAQAVLFPLGAVRNCMHIIRVEEPGLTVWLEEMVSSATKDMEYADFVSGFMSNIPSIRKKISPLQPDGAGVHNGGRSSGIGSQSPISIHGSQSVRSPPSPAISTRP